MPDTLTHRAEVALIGALLTDRTLLADVRWLAYTDLADSDHQQIFKTIADLRISRPDLEGAALAVAVARTVEISGVDAEYLMSLAANCPDAAAVTVYGRMVQEAALRRDLAARAEALTAQPVDQHTAQLAESLHAHGRSLDDLFVKSAPRHRTDTSPAIAAREREVLADLIQHPEVLAETTWLRPEMFVTTASQKVHEAILAVGARGEPVQELTVAWELGRRQALDDLAGGKGAEPAAPAGPTPGDLGRLAATSVEAGTAIAVGRELLTQHMRELLAVDAVRVLAQAAAAETAFRTSELILRPERSVSHGHLPQVQLLPPLQPGLEQLGPQFAT